MHNTLRYIMLFVCIAVIQVCFIDRLELGMYIQPLVYSCFVIMLPLQLSRLETLLLGALSGLAIDVLSGTPGLNTIATTAISYIRPALLFYIVGQEEVKEGGTPSRRRFANNKFLVYSLYMLLVHNLVYFGVESLSLSMLGYTMAKVAISTAICIMAIIIVDRVFNARTAN